MKKVQELVKEQLLPVGNKVGIIKNGVMITQGQIPDNKIFNNTDIGDILRIENLTFTVAEKRAKNRVLLHTYMPHRRTFSNN